MFLILTIMFCLIYPNLILADDNSNEDASISWKYSYLIGIIVGCILISIIFVGITSTIYICTKKRLSQQQSDVSIEKFYIENPDMTYQDPKLKQIRPILTVSEVVYSMKQALDNLGTVVIPQQWITNEAKSNLSV